VIASNREVGGPSLLNFINQLVFGKPLYRVGGWWKYGHIHYKYRERTFTEKAFTLFGKERVPPPSIDDF